jgi:Putative auto-transporter adhesin, head GIN domain
MVSFKKLREMVQVKGSGNVVSKSFPISSFLRLHIAVRGTTELIQSQEERVEVEMDENLIDHFEVGNAGRTLYLSTEGKIKKPVFTKCTVRIYFRQLENLVIRCDEGNVLTTNRMVLQSPLDLKVQSVGNVTLDLSTPQLKAVFQMEGDVTLMGDCGTVDIRNQSEGNLMAKELFCSELRLKNQAQGNVEVFADKKIWISHMGQGYVHYYGDAQLMDVRQHGDGEVRHF